MAREEDRHDAPRVPSHATTPYLWMLFGAFSFATMAALAHLLGRWLDWRVVALSRTSIALALAMGIAWWRRTPLTFAGGRALWLRSLSGSISLLGSFYSLTHLPIALAVTLLNLFPVWVALLSRVVLREPAGLGAWTAIAAAVVGVALIHRPAFEHVGWGVLIPVGASLTTAMAMLGLNRVRGVAPLAIVVHFSAVSTTAVAASLLAATGGSVASGVGPATGLLMLACAGAALAGQFGITFAFARGPAARVAPIALCQVVFALGFDVVCWGRSFDAATLVGIALVVTPAAWFASGRR